jgi:hypothetical protein
MNPSIIIDSISGISNAFYKIKNKKKGVLIIGGLNWKTDKWGKFARKAIKKIKSLLVRNCSKKALLAAMVSLHFIAPKTPIIMLLIS